MLFHLGKHNIASGAMPIVILITGLTRFSILIGAKRAALSRGVRPPPARGGRLGPVFGEQDQTLFDRSQQRHRRDGQMTQHCTPQLPDCSRKISQFLVFPHVPRRDAWWKGPSVISLYVENDVVTIPQFNVAKPGDGARNRTAHSLGLRTACARMNAAPH